MRASTSSTRPASRCLSQIGQTLALDYRDSTVDPHTGFITRVGTDFAGVGGDAKFVRTKLDGTLLHSARPLDREQRLGHRGLGRRRLLLQFRHAGKDHRPLLPRRRQFARLPGRRRRAARSDQRRQPGRAFHLDAIDGVAFPAADARPISGCPAALSWTSARSRRRASNRGGARERWAASARRSTTRRRPGSASAWAFRGVRPFGLINIDVTPFVAKNKFDQTQVFRFGFGTRF